MPVQRLDGRSWALPLVAVKRANEKPSGTEAYSLMPEGLF